MYLRSSHLKDIVRLTMMSYHKANDALNNWPQIRLA